MKRAKMRGGWAWLADAAGSTLFAWGMAAAVAAHAAGDSREAWPLAAMLAGGLCRAAALALVHRLAIADAQSAGRDLRGRLFRLLLGRATMPPPSIGQVATYAIDHVATMEAYRARFQPLRLAAVAAPLAIAGIVAAASIVSAAILVATLIPFAAGMILAGTAARRASERQVAALGQLSGLFVDRLRTLPIIRHFAAEDRIARQVTDAARDVAARTLVVLRAAFLSSATLEFFAALSVALVAVYCGFTLLGLLPFRPPETLTLREAFFALAMAPEFYLPMRRLAAAYHEKQLGDAAQAELDALPEGLPQAAADGGADFSGLTVEALAVEWPGRSIGPVSFTLGKTGLVALTGPTGSGKTSLLAAIAGRVAPGAVAWAAQQPLLLPGTLRDNLVLAAPHADEAAIDAAARAAGLEPLLAARGLDLAIDHRGSGLSGGERRRIGLARSLLADRPLLLCDEPTADLDDESAAAIIALLVEQSAGRAIIVATHDARLIAAAGQAVAL